MSRTFRTQLSHACPTRRTACSALLTAALFVAAVHSAAGQVLIPVENRTSLVFDDTRNMLLIATSDGTIERWSVDAQMLLEPFTNIGQTLSGMDVTTDGAFAYVGDSSAGATSGFVRKVDLSDGSRTNITYDLESLERGVQDLAIASNGKAFFTTDFAGSGWTQMKEIDLSDDSITPRRSVRQRTGIARGPDRSVLFFQEANISSGPIFTYNANTDNFPAGRDTSSFIGGLPAAVNRDGTLIAFRGSLLDDDLNTVELLPGPAGGYQFDPFRDILYIANTSSNEIVAIDSNTTAELDRFAIGESYNGGRMAISGDTRFLFVRTDSGVRQVANPLAVPEPGASLLAIVGVIVVAPLRRRRLA